jgi:hypothetical protein
MQWSLWAIVGLATSAAMYWVDHSRLYPVHTSGAILVTGASSGIGEMHTPCSAMHGHRWNTGAAHVAMYPCPNMTRGVLHHSVILGWRPLIRRRAYLVLCPLPSGLPLREKGVSTITHERTIAARVHALCSSIHTSDLNFAFIHSLPSMHCHAVGCIVRHIHAGHSSDPTLSLPIKICRLYRSDWFLGGSFCGRSWPTTEWRATFA